MATHEKSTPTTLEPGKVLLERYVVEKQVAEGGMAAIHLTHDRATGEKVAIKVLYPYYSQNPVVCTRFLDEGRIQRYLDHPNIINVLDIVEKPQLAIVMEYIDGPTLDEHLQARGPFDIEQLLSLMLPVLSAVGFAHHKGVIHRDIKPSNILLKPTMAGMVPKIMDFGVAKVERGGKDLTAAGTTVGTLHYMSPEQIVGSRDIDGRADIYSLGVTIYKLCTGEVPFNAATEFALMMAQVEAQPTPPSQLQAGISEPLEEIILKALAKRPADRFQSVKELTSALLSLEKGRPDYSDTDTDTAPLPARLLEYAMMADEIAIDRTGELDMTQVEELIAASQDTREENRPEPETIDATIKLDVSRIRAQIIQDADASQELRSTTELDRAKDGESTHVDSRELTQPLSMTDASTRESQKTLAADTSSERHSLSQETTHPFRSRGVDRSGEFAADSSQQITTERTAKVDKASVDTQDETRRHVLKGEVMPSGGANEDAGTYKPLRARASGRDSMTKRSREDAIAQIEEIARQNSSLSSLQRVLLVGAIVVVVGLSAALAWVLWAG